MNPIFKYNSNAKYLTKDFKSGYNNNDFSLLDVHLKEKRPSDKIQLLNIFKDHHSVAKSSHKVAGYDECALSNIFWIKFYNGHGKYNPELNEYSHMYISQLNFAMLFASRKCYRFHVHFYVRIILHNLGVSLPQDNSFSKVNNSYINSAHYSFCDDYGVNVDKTWLNGD